MTFVRRQTAYRMRHCCARRIDEYSGRRKLVRTPTRSAERHPQGVCRIRKAAEPPTAAQQRIIEAEANRLAVLTRQRRAQAFPFRRHKSRSSPKLPIKALSLGGCKGGHSLSQKRMAPLGAAARTPHFPSALCAESNRSPEGAQKRSSPFGLLLFYFSQMTGFWRSDSTKALAFSTASARGSLTCSPVRMSLQDTTPALISSSPRK